jgi:hypothetical protein
MVHQIAAASGDAFHPWIVSAMTPTGCDVKLAQHIAQHAVNATPILEDSARSLAVY